MRECVRSWRGFAETGNVVRRSEWGFSEREGVGNGPCRSTSRCSFGVEEGTPQDNAIPSSTGCPRLLVSSLILRKALYLVLELIPSTLTFSRDKPHLWGKALFVGMCSWTSTGVLDIAVSSVLSVHPNYDKVFIVGGNDWLPARAAFSHDKFESMGLISLEKKSTRHEKKLGKKLAEGDSESLSGVSAFSLFTTFTS